MREESRPTIQEEQDEFVETFNQIGDWMLQYDCLLELTADMEPLREGERTECNMVTDCQTRLWLVMEECDGMVRLRADSEALIVKGIVGIIVALLDRRSPAEILAADLDFLDRTGLSAQLSVDRTQNIRRLLGRIRAFAQTRQTELSFLK